MPYAPRGNSQPLHAAARERLRNAQRREAAAVDAVTRADRLVAAARHRLARVVDEREQAVARAVQIREEAVSTLVAVSGVDRAALLLSEDPASVRRSSRAARARGKPLVD